MLNLEAEITKINRIGAATGRRLKNLGIETAQDLLFYFPFRYDDFSKITSIENLKAGETANIVGHIELIQNKRSLRRRMYITEALINDGSEQLKVVWFNQPFIGKSLKVGDQVSLAGKIEEDYSGLFMTSPAYEKIIPPTPLYQGGIQGKSPQPPFEIPLNPPLLKGAGTVGIHTQGLVPNYHLTANLTNKQLRFLIKQVIGLADKVEDWLPEEIRREEKLISFSDSLKMIHFPSTAKEVEAARRRLAFNELFLVQLQSRLIRQEIKSSQAEPIEFKELETKKFVEGLPFKLTDAQRKAAWEILRDLESDKPMARLLEGDVGSGKTVVAAIAMLNTVLNGQQAVLMVPTEILARQHYESIGKLFQGWQINLGLVTRNWKELNHEKNKEDVIMKGADIIIGTHALIQEDIKFNDLGLVVIDEQHRFGVEQRKTLVGKNKSGMAPHLLSMTATPIPRSLALALYGDLDLSIINEMPANRKKIVTRIVPESGRQEAYKFIRAQIKEGRQVFVICPLIDISDKLGVKSVKEEFEKLDKQIFPEIKMGALHGRLKAKEKEVIMRQFLNNDIKILVSTSVVEVGVDVPNATIMMIEGADRFGLAQLHQFRGRVGRGEHQSYCFLLSESNSPMTLKRLSALTQYHDGFSLAQVDLKFRGPGEVYGTMQKGFPELKIASLFDYELMKKAKTAAEKLIEDDNLNKYPALKRELGKWEKNVHLE